MKEIPIHCSYTDLIDPTELVPNPRNPNQHPKKQIELLAKLIQSQGWRTSVTVSKRSGFVVRGHGRLQAALLLGCKVPVDRQDYESEAVEYADLIADNCIAEISQFDPQVLISLIEELEAGGLDMELTGFDAPDLERFKLEYGIPDIEFPEFTEEIAKDVKKIVCPHCGKEFAV